MEYPLGPFPPEVLRNIVYQGHDPNLYRSLRLTSPRVNRAIEPVFPEQCRSPISVEEFVSFVSSYPYPHPIFIRSRDPLVGTTSIEHGDNDTVILYQSQKPIGTRSRQLSFDQFATLVPNLLQEYPLIDLPVVYSILNRRKLCVDFDPHYALRTVWEMAKRRYQYSMGYLNRHQGQEPETTEGVSLLGATVYGLAEVLGLLSQVIAENTSSYYELQTSGLTPTQIFIDNDQIHMDRLGQEISRRLQQ